MKYETSLLKTKGEGLIGYTIVGSVLVKPGGLATILRYLYKKEKEVVHLRTNLKPVHEKQT